MDKKQHSKRAKELIGMGKVEVNGYSLSKSWFAFAMDTKDCKPVHTAIYFWIVELNNRLGWKKEFGLPTTDTMEVLSIGNKRTYLQALNDLELWGFIKIIQRSKNQYQSCIIELCRGKNDIASDTALPQHQTQHCPSVGTSIAPIDKPINNITNKINKPIPTESGDFEKEVVKFLPKVPWEQYSVLDFDSPKKDLLNDLEFISKTSSSHNLTKNQTEEWVKKFFIHIEKSNEGHANLQAHRKHCTNWINLKIQNEKNNKDGKTTFKAGQRTNGQVPTGGYSKL